MIKLLHKATFDHNARPYIVRIVPTSNSIQSKQDCVLEQEVNFTKGKTNKGSFTITPMIEEDLVGDVLLCSPETGQVQRLIREQSETNSLLLTERCDQHCVMCSQPPRSTNDAWRFPLLTEALCLAPENKSIVLSGGEPTLYKSELFALIKEVFAARKDLHIHVLSNGQHLEHADITKLTQLHETGQLSWGIPLYSWEAKDHDQIVGKEGAFNHLIQNLYILASTDARIELRTVITAKNALELAKLARFIARHLPFVSKWAIMAMEPIGFALTDLDNLFFDHSEAKFTVQNAIEIAQLYDLNVQLYNFPRCTIDEKYRDTCQVSISDWKNKYLEECDHCAEKDLCCGFFEWYDEKTEWKGIHALGETHEKAP